MIRLIGAIFVIAATSYAGVEYGRNLQFRIQQLNILKKIFTNVYSDVEYGACTLVETFERIGVKQENLYQKFLYSICELIKSSTGMPLGLIFSIAVENTLSASALQISDKEELVQLGKQLSNQQRKGQLRILELYIQELHTKIEELEQEKQDKQKLGRILGISSGVLIVILLL